MKVTVNTPPGNRVSINNDDRESVRTVGLGAGDGWGESVTNAYETANLAYTFAANNAFLVGNSAYTQANNAYTQANLVFEQANTAYTQGNIALGQANSAWDKANLAYTFAANNAHLTANSAYDAANAVFAQSNSINVFAYDSRYVANLAYDFSNVINSIAISAYTKANTFSVDFLGLTDTPNTYSGFSNAFVAVNETADGLVLVDQISIDELIHTVDTAPTTIDQDTVEVYLTGSGTTPNRELRYCVKFENGEEIILSSILV